MSADLIWSIIRNNNSFLVKRNGAQFTSEPNNLTNLNSFKYSGLAGKGTIGISPSPDNRGVVVTSKKPGLHLSNRERLFTRLPFQRAFVNQRKVLQTLILVLDIVLICARKLWPVSRPSISLRNLPRFTPERPVDVIPRDKSRMIFDRVFF